MSEPREQLVQECFSNLFMIKRLLTFQLYHENKSVGLSPSQIELMFIVSHKQPVSLKKLAFIMQLTPGAVTQLVDNLVQDGVLLREQDTKDRRVLLISLSKKGDTKIKELKEINQKRAERLSEVLSDEELQKLSEIQKKIISNMRVDLEAAKEEAGT